MDLLLILATLGLVILDVIGGPSDSSMSKLTRLRGLFRILRIVLLIRKVGALRRIQELDRLYEAQLCRQTEDETYELRTPMEKVLIIIRTIGARVDQQREPRVIEDLNYCLRVLASNNLYDAELVVKGSSGIEILGMDNAEMELALSKVKFPAEGPIASELSVKSSQP